ncbi:LysR substrate-binding domain-containing protein [Propionivibrio soli]|jgi:DNA-binding transcriptional LysR family regulator|uniref:LysR substrate-binding domain-containing protein n=1 Tax=Propionivibrio soli TaxID=2976531 RepID=UPI0021E8DE5C|nr:LysR substrate-binding domain-containing protein [Propionivibrio soli]
MKVTLRQLEIFAAIATYGQVTRAAEGVAMTQSAASMALSDLERQLGSPLFDRVGRQLVLNEAGRQLLPKALQVLDSVREIETAASSSTAAFDLRLGASLTIGNHLLPGLLAQLQERYPSSRFDVSLRNTEQVVADLLAYRIDIGFVEGPVQDERLQRFFWRHDRLSVFVPPEHRLAGKVATQDDLVGVSWILRERGSGTREVFDRALANATLPVRIAFELEQPEAIRQFVRAGLGLGCLPWLELRDACAAGWLALVDTPFLNLQRQFQAVVHRDKHLSLGIRSVLSLCGVDLV